MRRVLLRLLHPHLALLLQLEYLKGYQAAIADERRALLERLGHDLS